MSVVAEVAFMFGIYLAVIVVATVIVAALDRIPVVSMWLDAVLSWDEADDAPR